ncbi:hypothetical protein, partial [Paraburkholderia sp. RL17-373-BIF-A]|uniref:hypothetical protein n=1 Tax=Paraburkholderia sp. RL17-373-BIF-A TaxID=3031629 RepID=UPI0038B7155C
MPTYTAAVDAAGSGSRIYLYKSMPSNGFGTIESMFHYASSAISGLSSYADSPVEAGLRGLQPLLDCLDLCYANHLQKSRVRVSVLGSGWERSVVRGAAIAIYDSVTQSIESAHACDVDTITGAGRGDCILGQASTIWKRPSMASS